VSRVATDPSARLESPLRAVRPGAASWRRSPRADEAIRVGANVVGATGAAYFAYVSLQAYLGSGRPIGIAFVAEQLVVVVAYLTRHRARLVTGRLGDWFVAFGGTFTPVLFRPDGAHPQWGLQAGLVLQLIGLAICFSSFLALGRSFGFAAADRGLVQRGPYALVRHPIYLSYVALQTGYLCQSLSVRNVVVVIVATGFNVCRIRAEERVLSTNPEHAADRARVRWRMLPGVF
jgi:protein-S-isoprenylcysteine O-methyltransferase Ste14